MFSRVFSPRASVYGTEGFRTKLKKAGKEGFFELIEAVNSGLRPVVKASKGSKPVMYAIQRHYLSQRSKAEQDGKIEADLRTCGASTSSKVKKQPEWGNAIFELLVNKRSNIQFGIEMYLSYGCPKIRSEAAVDLFADSWKAMKPLLEFVLND